MCSNDSRIHNLISDVHCNIQTLSSFELLFLTKLKNADGMIWGRESDSEHCLSLTSTVTHRRKTDHN